MATTITTFSTVGQCSQAFYLLHLFNETTLPRREKPSAVIIILDPAACTRVMTASEANPENIGEIIASDLHNC